jgi:hypothetical protein
VGTRRRPECEPMDDRLTVISIVVGVVIPVAIIVLVLLLH